MNSFNTLLTTIAAAPDNHIAKAMTDKVHTLIGLNNPAVVLSELKEIRDHCVYSGFASDFGMYILNETIHVLELSLEELAWIT